MGRLQSRLELAEAGFQKRNLCHLETLLAIFQAKSQQKERK